MKLMSLMISEETKEKLHLISSKKGISVSALIRMILNEYLEHDETNKDLHQV